MLPEELAQLFHETYERLAPDFAYKTRVASAKPWADVPEQNKKLMIAVAGEVLKHLDEEDSKIWLPDEIDYLTKWWNALRAEHGEQAQIITTVEVLRQLRKLDLLKEER